MSNKIREQKIIPLSKLIIRDTDNPRQSTSPGAREALQESIKQKGILMPILVAEEGDGNYRVVAGFNRAHCAVALKHRDIPVTVMSADETAEAYENGVIENVVRDDMKTYDIAVAIKTMMDNNNLTRDEVATKLSKSPSFISNYMGLFDLPQEIQDKVKEDKLQVTHVRFLHSFKKKVDDKMLIHLSKKVEGKNQDALAKYRDKLNTKLEKADTDSDKMKAINKASTEAVKETEEEATNGARSATVINRAIRTLNTMAKSEKDAAKLSLLGERVQALNWVLGDDSVELFKV